MAEALSSDSSADASDRPPPSKRRAGPHRGRFLIAYAVLGVIGGVALVAGATLLDDSSSNPFRQSAAEEPTWSRWYPTADGLAGANQIAQYVGRRYRLDNGKQLVGVRAGPLSVQNLRVVAIAVRPEGADGDISYIDAQQSVGYVLCGFGDNCSIPEGKPTAARERLLRREALELALYTFQYVNVDSVVAFLPPQPNADPLYSFLFQRDAYREELSQPLRYTIPESPPPQPNEMTPIEIQRIDELTEPARYRFQFSQQQDGAVLLVLDPPNLDGEGNGGGG
jgi:hypothetical protein